MALLSALATVVLASPPAPEPGTALLLSALPPVVQKIGGGNGGGNKGGYGGGESGGGGPGGGGLGDQRLDKGGGGTGGAGDSTVTRPKSSPAPVGGSSAPPHCPTTPAGSGPAPAGPASPAPSATPPSLPGLGDPTSWTLWWEHNRATYLNIRSHLRDAATVTGSDDFFLGNGTSSIEPDMLRPSPALIERTVVPALEAALGSNRATSVRMQAVLALARIGAAEEERATVLVERFAGLLRESNRELREVAALAMGLLGSPRALPELRALFLNERSAHDRVGEARVDFRLRAFAGYGLALLAEARPEPELRRSVARAAMDVLEGDRSSTYEIEIAALHALSLAPIENRPSRDSLRQVAGDANPDRRLLSRRSQVAWLLDYFTDSRRGDALPRPIHAQLPLALARLCEGAPDSLRRTVCEAILDSLRPGKRPSLELRQGAAIALGLLGRAGESEVDQRVRVQLTRLTDKGDPGTRRLALVSLGRVASRPGRGEEPFAGESETLETLRSTLVDGGSQLEPWAALALGAYAFEYRERGEAVDEEVVFSLKQETALSRRPQEVGAFAIALGMAGASDSTQLLLSRLHTIGDPSARAQIALGLGLLGERSAREGLRDLLDHSLSQPELLRSAAVGLALLGEKDVVPELQALLEEESGRGSIGAVASALGLVGDGRAVEPLMRLFTSREEPESTHAFAAQALGRVCDPRFLPWEAPLSIDAHYMAATRTLTDGETGVLDREW